MATIYQKADELVNGKKGSVFFTINGRRKEIPGIAKIEANVRLSTAPFVTVGTTKKQTRITGREGVGSITFEYWMIKIFYGELYGEYKRTGIFPEWDVMIINEHGGATLGSRTVQLFGCQLTGEIPVALLDSTTDDGLRRDVSFTFEDDEGLEEFGDPQRVGREG